MNIHQTESHGRFLELIGWRVLRHKYKGKLTYYFLRKIPLLPVHALKVQRLPLDLTDWDFIKKIRRDYRVVMTMIEVDICSTAPTIDVPEASRWGYRPSRDYMLTTKTRIIDLTKSTQELLKEMKPKARYNLKKCSQNGLTARVVELRQVVKNESLFDSYYDLLKKNAKRIKMSLLPKSWIKRQWTTFGKHGFVVEVKHNDQLMAMASFYLSATTCSYSYNGSTQEGRKKFAPTLAIWEGMVEGKKRGLKILDFDGVYDERFESQKRFAGFGRFKAGFGGEEVYFPPMYRKYGF